MEEDEIATSLENNQNFDFEDVKVIEKILFISRTLMESDDLELLNSLTKSMDNHLAKQILLTSADGNERNRFSALLFPTNTHIDFTLQEDREEESTESAFTLSDSPPMKFISSNLGNIANDVRNTALSRSEDLVQLGQTNTLSLQIASTKNLYTSTSKINPKVSINVNNQAVWEEELDGNGVELVTQDRLILFYSIKGLTVHSLSLQPTNIRSTLYISCNHKACGGTDL